MEQLYGQVSVRFLSNNYNGQILRGVRIVRAEMDIPNPKT